jgi:DNA polymerase-4
MDAFFVSVELRRHPELMGKPVVVGGAGPRGVVAAASYEARRFDVHSALPSSIARRRCPHAVFLQGDHEHYTEVSRQVKAVFDRYTPLVEPLSLDEAFLDVTGSRALFGPAEEIAHALRGAIRTELDLGCSVGVASNKFFAKLASVDAKPRATRAGVEPGPGVAVIDRAEESEYLQRLPIRRLWGVGPATAKKLEAIGVATAGDLARLDEMLLVAKLGPGLAAHLGALARGDDDRPVEPDREAKSISHEETFATNRHTNAELQRELVRLADGVARRLRAADLGARTLTLKLRFDDGFTTITRSATSPHPTDLAPEIVSVLGPVLADLDVSPGIRLLGVAASNLGPAHRQLTLDDLDDKSPDWSSASGAVDEIRERFGAAAIGPASNLESDGLRVTRKGGQQWGPDR